MLFLLNSPYMSSFVSDLFDFNASLNDVAPVSPTLLSVDLMRMEKKEWIEWMSFVLFLLYSLSRLSVVSVVFDFNAPFRDIVPLSPISLPVVFYENRKSGLLMNVICVLFLLSSQLILSSVRIVFDFNVLLNDVAPITPILFPVDLLRTGKE